jgi:hypothetical protein
LEWKDATYENNRLGRELAGEGTNFVESKYFKEAVVQPMF